MNWHFGTEKYFLLPYLDGTTIIMYNSKRPDKPDIQMHRWYKEICSDAGEEVLDRYLQVFPAEAELKVALFEEMLRMVPTWMEYNVSWYWELSAIAANGISSDKKRRTPQDNTVLEWLLLALSEPKIRELHQSSFGALLELAAEHGPCPSKVFLLEYCDSRTNYTSYGFLSTSVDEVIPLVYNFGEVGKGKCFSKSLSTALETLGDNSFALWGKVSSRYRCVLMVEFLSHPGVLPLEDLSERSSSSVILKNPGLHRIADPSQARVMALLLFKKTATTSPSRKPLCGIIVSVWIMLLAHVAYTAYMIRR